MTAAPAALDWDTEGADWPNRATSRFLECGGLRWHVQVMGEPAPGRPIILLLHGTGAATHSWRTLGPLLAEDFTVIAPDLPGHGFTGTPKGADLSLPGMAAALSQLLQQLRDPLGGVPSFALGHSAGAAVLARMCIDGRLDLRALAGINAALLPLQGLAGQVFLPAAKILSASALVPRLFAWRAAAGGAATERLIRGTGSILDAEGVALYGRLVRNAAHVSGVLRMMASWDLTALERDLPRLPCPLLLMVGTRDRTVRPGDALRIRERVPGARIVELAGLGHLAHEERAAEVAAHLRALVAG
ncbi:MAG: alpha/beta fold hydrolase BchO [bacterium]|jgi:magnesium chelatase accessory protein|nr:alpha/beta fold hydrolase [Betaproteobacteria bacterium]